jgi:hypothetical protein
MFGSDIQSPIITSMGLNGWFSAKVLKVYLRSEVEPDGPLFQQVSV